MYVEAGIIARCKKHDKAAFVELFQMYEKYLYRLCYSYVQHEQDALDLAQEVYIKVFKNIATFDSKLPFHPWFRKVAVNTCLNFKRAVHFDSVSLNTADEGDKALEETIPAESSVEDEVLDAEMSKLLKENIELLKPKLRMVMVLRYYEGLSYDEISVLLKEPLGTVKTDLYRAKKLLREKLKETIQGYLEG